ncbi:hypothetical protein AAFF_G00153770 [Aldrovandia affinis]|uniref:Uncharacterized protein n=1 Tax=Aldrovandia affinis TaxID=143900 RepID=A0AAD7SZP3_9TELE|nr:hypothetical protein AAFF_G00153770 [Aldrovandia affinis]
MECAVYRSGPRIRSQRNGLLPGVKTHVSVDAAVAIDTLLTTLYRRGKAVNQRSCLLGRPAALWEARGPGLNTALFTSPVTMLSGLGFFIAGSLTAAAIFMAGVRC